MSEARFDSLDRHKTYVFVNGLTTAIRGVLHEIMPDGTLKVAGGPITSTTRDIVYFLNPDTILHAQQIRNGEE